MLSYINVLNFRNWIDWDLLIYIPNPSTCTRTWNLCLSLKNDVLVVIFCEFIVTLILEGGLSEWPNVGEEFQLLNWEILQQNKTWTMHVVSGKY